MRRLASFLPLLILLPVAHADTIAVIGTGNVGAALGTEFAAQGHTIVYGSRTPENDKVAEIVARTEGDASAATQPEAAKRADIVVLAVGSQGAGSWFFGVGGYD